MNIRQAEIFKAVMSEGTVTAAADKLFITQPSISKHLKLLEHNLGLSLFTRSGNRLIPTQEGFALYDQLQRLYVGLDKVQRFANDLKHNRNGEISIASPPLLTQIWLPKIIGKYIQDKPNVSISLPAGGSEGVIESVAAHKVDIGVGLFTREIPGIDSIPLFKIPLVCAIPKGHILATKREISAKDLTNQSIITLNHFSRWSTLTESILKEHNIRASRRLNAFMTSTACQLVAEGAGIAVVDLLSASSYKDKGVEIRPFSPFHEFDFYLFKPNRWSVTSITNNFIECLEIEAKKLIDNLKAEYPSI